MEKLYCLNCDNFVDTKIIEKEEIGEVKGVPITCKVKVRICAVCDCEVLDADLEDQNLDLYFTEYRKIKKLLQPDEIKEIRQKYGLSQTSFARLLGFGDKTITRYENGSIQDVAHDNLIRNVDKFDSFFNLWELRKDCLTEAENKKIRILNQQFGVIEYKVKEIANYVMADYGYKEIDTIGEMKYA